MSTRPSVIRSAPVAILTAVTLTTAAVAATAESGPAIEAAQTTVTPAQVEAPVPELDWQPCGGGLDEFLCATAEVPTDYDEPHGATTTLALTKLPATDPDQKIGTLFTNPGGPGGSGVEFVHLMGPTAFTDDVRTHFDILGFDPRAVAGSDPATCYRTLDEELEAVGSMPAFPVTQREERRFYTENLRLSMNCKVTSRERFEHSSTANVARDMDLLRQAVGDEQLSYVGYSYGTFLGATYAKLFPERVRAMTLDGTIVPEDYAGEHRAETATIGERMNQGPGASETFGEFLRLCAEAGPQGCALAALGDPATVVEETFERLKDHPAELVLPDGSSVEVTYATAVAITFSALYEPVSWAAHAALLAQLAIGDTELTGAEATLVERTLPPRPQRPRRGEDYASVGGALASVCVDTGTTGHAHSYAERADAADADAAHFGRYRAWVGINCEYLRLSDDDAYTGPWDQDMESPVLVIGTRFDPATPYEGTEPYAEHFPDARVLTVEGWGHTVLGKSTCADEVIAAYLVDPATPEDDSTCGQDLAPFTTEPTVLDHHLPRIPPIPVPHATSK